MHPITGSDVFRVSKAVLLKILFIRDRCLIRRYLYQQIPEAVMPPQVNNNDFVEVPVGPFGLP